MSDIIYLSNVRLSWPNLVEPQRRISTDTGNERISYNADFILPPDHAGFTQFMAKVNEMALAKWKEHTASVIAMVNSDKRLRCYGDGSQKVHAKTFEMYEGYPGNMYITAGKDTAPQVIQADGAPIDPTNTMAYQALTRAMYNGCRVNAAVRPWLQENKYGRAVRCDLIAIQFAGDDKPLGEGMTDASAMFGPVTTRAVPAFAAAPAPAMPLPPFMMG
jgi:hypothetical protein